MITHLTPIDLLEIESLNLLRQGLDDDYTDSLYDGIQLAKETISDLLPLDDPIVKDYIKILEFAKGDRLSIIFMELLILWKFNMVYPDYLHYSYTTNNDTCIKELVIANWLEESEGNVPLLCRITQSGKDYLNTIITPEK